MQQLLAESRSNDLTTILTLHVPSGEGRASNTGRNTTGDD